MSEEFHPEEYSEEEFVTVFVSRNVSAEIEAEAVHGLLASAGLNSLIVRENVPELPTGKVSVRVLASHAEEAQKLMQEAQRQGTAESAEETSE